MKALFIYLSLFIATAAIAQRKLIKVTGHWYSGQENNQLSEKTLQELFIATKGDLVLPNEGYLFYPSDTDARKLNKPYITVIYLYGSNASNEKGDCTLTLYPLSPAEGTYYLKRKKRPIDKEREDDYRYTLRWNPYHASLKDTIVEDAGYPDLTNTKIWIDNLDNNQEVTIQRSMCLKRTYGGYIETYYGKISVASWAEIHLHSVVVLFRSETSDDWTKQQWEKWYKNKMKESEK